MSKIKIFCNRGITMIELLVVLAVLGMMILIVLPRFSTIRENAVLKTAVSDILSSLDKAKSKTLSSLNSSEYGVHFQSDKVIIFKGKVFSAVAADNETANMTAPAKITNVTFGGVSGTTGNMYFNRLLGVPSTTGTITVSAASSAKIITIYATGVVSSN